MIKLIKDIVIENNGKKFDIKAGSTLKIVNENDFDEDSHDELNVYHSDFIALYKNLQNSMPKIDAYVAALTKLKIYPKVREVAREFGVKTLVLSDALFKLSNVQDGLYGVYMGNDASEFAQGDIDPEDIPAVLKSLSAAPPAAPAAPTFESLLSKIKPRI
jgi:hypothetical protein